MDYSLLRNKIYLLFVIIVISIILIFTYTNIKCNQISLIVVTNLIRFILCILFAMLVLSLFITSVSIFTNIIPFNDGQDHPLSV